MNNSALAKLEQKFCEKSNYIPKLITPLCLRSHDVRLNSDKLLYNPFTLSLPFVWTDSWNWSFYETFHAYLVWFIWPIYHRGVKWFCIETGCISEQVYTCSAFIQMEIKLQQSVCHFGSKIASHNHGLQTHSV